MYAIDLRYGAGTSKQFRQDLAKLTDEIDFPDSPPPTVPRHERHVTVP